MSIRETEKFQRGRNGEQIVAQALKQDGWMIIPSYDYSGEDEHAPRMEGLKLQFILPDLDACKDGQRRWAEVKTKRIPTRGRISGKDEHGIPLRHWTHYQAVERESGCPVWLYIFEESSREIIRARLSTLGEGRHSRSQEMGDMIFWLREQFELFARV